MRERLPSAAARYLFAAATIAVAVLGRWLLDPWLGDNLPLVTLFAAVAATVWYGGWRPAVPASALGYLACNYLFIEPRGALDHDAGTLIGFVAYVVSCSIIIAFGQALRRARKHARFERELFRTTLASIGDAVITTDLAGRVTYLNATAESLTGWAHAEAAGRPIAEIFRIVNEQTRQPVENPATRALREGTVVGLANHTVLIAKDGTERPIDDSAAPIRDGEGATIGCVLIFRDITARRQSEKDLRDLVKTQARLVAIIESSDDAIVSKTLEGIIQSWNSGAQRLFGYTPEEAVGKSINLLIPPELQSEERSILERLRRGERLDHFETVRVAKDGRRLHISLTVSPIRDHSGQIVGASKVARDITDRKRAEAERQENDRRKDEFLATLAHELRNPLAPIRNSLEIMKRAGGNFELMAQARGTMDRQVAQMERLIEDLLDISRITRNRLELRNESIDLATVVHLAVEGCRPLAESYAHEVSVHLPADPIHVYGDPVRLAQVFGNLLNNACKYTQRNGRIALSAERQGETVLVTVKDNGVGIPPDVLPLIFDMFTQGDRSLERSHGGLGIGLTLVKQIVEMHRGTVEASSGGHDQGSEFNVRLPMLAPPPVGAELPAAAPSQAVTPRRILVVDDNQDNAQSLAKLLKMAGHDLQLAYDGLEAVATAERFRPDLVLLDLGLPKLNGFDVCRELRAQPWGRVMKIIALTGWGQDADRQKSNHAGFDGHLVKPLVYADLEALLAAPPSPA